MSLELDFSEIEDKIKGDHRPTDCVDDDLVEEIWLELEGCAGRERIRDVATEVAADFRNAPVTQFVPIFVRRRTVERLRSSVE